MSEFKVRSLDISSRSFALRRKKQENHQRHALTSSLQFKRTKSGIIKNMYQFMGAHLEKVDGIEGTRFSVWAPNAAEVSVVCDSNHWKKGENHLTGSDSGTWTGFMPHIKTGERYKYSIKTKYGEYLEKADPYAFQCEHPPNTASIVTELSGMQWQDSNWMQNREKVNWFEEPISIYEVHLASWKRPEDGRKYFSYHELAHMLVDYLQEMGFTHLELLPMTEYPFDGSWGYQTTGYFAPTSRFGTPEEFAYFVDYCHQANIGVIMDWVPAHFPTDPHALGKFDGTCLYEHEDPRQGFHPDWKTLIFNYSRSEVKEFLLSSARFWLDVYHVDALRVDAVASMLYLDYSREDGEWIPNEHGGRENLDAIEFLKEMNIALHQEFPGVLTFAEESTSWAGVSHPVYNGGLGFSMKWDMGWMNDTLEYFERDPIHRKHHQDELSFRQVYAYNENFLLPLSHDEVVHGKKSLLSKMPGGHWQQFANLRLLYSYQYSMPGKKLLFMGDEFAQWEEWNHDSSLDWPLLKEFYHDGIRKLVGDLNRIYKEEPALYETDYDADAFHYIQCDDNKNSVYAYFRFAKSRNDYLVILCNFTPVPQEKYKIGVPVPGFYKEIFSSDSQIYGGENYGNSGGLYTEPGKSHGLNQSLSLTLPPLGMVILKPFFK